MRLRYRWNFRCHAIQYAETLEPRSMNPKPRTTSMAAPAKSHQRNPATPKRLHDSDLTAVAQRLAQRRRILSAGKGCHQCHIGRGSCGRRSYMLLGHRGFAALCSSLRCLPEAAFSLIWKIRVSLKSEDTQKPVNFPHILSMLKILAAA